MDKAAQIAVSFLDPKKELGLKKGLLKDVGKNIVVNAESCEKIATLLSLKTVDAVIGWDVFHVPFLSDKSDPDYFIKSIEKNRVKKSIQSNNE